MFDVILRDAADWSNANLFQAWTQRIDNQENILQSLSEVPQVMSYSFAKFNLYRNDVALRNYIQDLYTTLLESLDTLISILLRQYDEKCQ
jgi:hypothetical protein